MDRKRQRLLQQIRAEVRSGRYRSEPGQLAAAVLQHLSGGRWSARRPGFPCGKGDPWCAPGALSFAADPPLTLRSSRARTLRKAREADQASALRSLFLASMPHELRTPLNAVIGFSDLLLQDRATLAPEQVRSLEDILASGRRLLALVNPVADLAMLAPGRLLLDLEPLDPAEQVRCACALAAPVAQKRRILLQQEPGGSRRSLLADRRNLQQILLQLLSDALGGSAEGETVGLRIDDREAQMRFEVHCARFADEDGGLDLTRDLVARQGGALHCETTPAGGAIRWFALPEGGPPAAPPAQSHPRRGAVLLVDDDAAHRALARRLLEGRGYRVLLADCGAAAVRLARSEACALVLMDLAMPKLDGFEAARRLKADPATASLPLVAFTAMGTLRDDARVRGAGFDGFLLKPVETAALEATLRQFVDLEVTT